MAAQAGLGAGGLLARLDQWGRGQNLALLAATVLFALLFPGPGLALRDLRLLTIPGVGVSLTPLTGMLALLIMSASLRWERDDFAHLLANLRTVAVGLVAIYALVPAVAVLFSLLLRAAVPRYAEPLSFGLMLMAAAPVAVTSVYWLGLCRGNVPLATALLTLSAVFSPLTMPLLLGVMTRLRPTSVAASPETTIAVLLLAVWLPLAAMSAWRRLAAAAFERARPVLSLGGTVGLLGVNLIVVSSAAGTLRALRVELLAPILILVLLYIALNFVWGYALGRVIGLSRPDKITLTFLVPMRLNSVAMAVALSHFGASQPLALVPPAIGAFHQFIAKLAHWFLVHVRRVLVREYERREVPGLALSYRPHVPAAWAAHAPPMEWRRAEVDNIDEEGCCLISDGSIPVHQLLELRLSREGRAQPPLEVRGVRIWDEPLVEGGRRHAGGVRFINLSHDWRRRCAALLADAPSIDSAADLR